MQIKTLKKTYLVQNLIQIKLLPKDEIQIKNYLDQKDDNLDQDINENIPR